MATEAALRVGKAKLEALQLRKFALSAVLAAAAELLLFLRGIGSDAVRLDECAV
jgi:hypothetical protein